MLNFALVGCGKMAHWHAQQVYQIPDVEVVAVVDPAPQRTKEIKDRYFPRAVELQTFDQLLSNPPKKLDAVIFVTPHSLHYPQATAAMEAGLHVLLEKPMVTSSHHAYDLWRTVKKTGKMLGITYQAPYTANYAYLARQRDADQLGKVQLISGWLSQSWLQNTAGTWRQDPAVAGGGQIYDSGSHLLNGIMWLMNDPVVEVACIYDKCHSPVDINGVAIARFQKGAIASIAIGGNCPDFRTEIQIQTDRMLIIVDQYGGKLEMTARDGKRILPNPEEEEPMAAAGRDAAAAAAAMSPTQSPGTPHTNFINALLGREQLVCPVRYGVLLSTLMDAMYESAATGRVVKVEPVPTDI
jgi:predicted dehydrogenase